MNINYDANMFVPFFVFKVPAFLESASECAFFFVQQLRYTCGHVFEYDALWKPENLHNSVTDITDSTFCLYFMQQTGEYNCFLFPVFTVFSVLWL